MKKLVLMLSMLFASHYVMALEVPKSSSFDSRIQRIAYNENDVVEVNCYAGGSTQIAFAPDEEILDIASGFSSGWEFEPRRNNLYVKVKSLKGKDSGVTKPIPGKWDTDLHVTTSHRIYTFQLILHPGEESSAVADNKKIAYLIRFKYPAEEAAKSRAAAQQRATEKRLAKNNKPRNWHYSMKVPGGSEGIAPSMAWDDGRFIYLKFPGNREFPAAFVVSADGSESLVNTHIDPKTSDVLVIQQLTPELVLRLGTQVVGIFNDSYDAYGVPAKDGTTVEGVRRNVNLNS
jgi:type IV secretion system protein VirB9